MMMPLMMSMNATTLAFGAAGGMFGANQGRMALANGVTGTESQAGVASLAAQDKAMALQGAMAQTNYLVSQALQGGAQGLKKKDQEQRARMQANGALFF